MSQCRKDMEMRRPHPPTIVNLDPKANSGTPDSDYFRGQAATGLADTMYYLGLEYGACSAVCISQTLRLVLSSIHPHGFGASVSSQ